MSENVKKIFVVLIVIVVMVLLGALVLNILLPNVTKTMINATEDMIFKATGMSFDFNGDGIRGSSGAASYQGDMNSDGTVQGDVDGFN